MTEFGRIDTHTEMPSVTFLQYFVLFYDENTSKILQDLGKYCFFFPAKIPFFSPKNTANLFARLASLPIDNVMLLEVTFTVRGHWSRVTEMNFA